MCKIISLSIIRSCIRLQKEGKKCLVNARFHSHWKEIEILGLLLPGVFFKVDSLLKVLINCSFKLNLKKRNKRKTKRKMVLRNQNIKKRVFSVLINLKRHA